MTKKDSFSFTPLFSVFFSFSLFNSSIAFANPAPKEKPAKTKNLRTTIVGTGCFWCTQADIEKLIEFKVPSQVTQEDF